MESEPAMICLNLTCPESTGNYIFVDVYSDNSKINMNLLLASQYTTLRFFVLSVLVFIDLTTDFYF